MQIPKLKGFFILRNYFSPPSSSSYQYASFHSTPVTLAKWKNKWNSDAGRDPQPPKTYVRYATRQKRADAKKALKNLLFNSGCSRLPFQNVGQTWETETDQTSYWDAEEADNSHGSNKKSRSKKSRRSSRGGKGKSRRENFSADFDEHSETVFRATFGNRCYTWSFRPWEEPSFESSSAEFEWRDQSNWTRNRSRVWDSTSETDDDDVKSCIGSYSDRTILGLPSTGLLTIEDVKSAFRSSALKWHPDKHQGPSQAVAEEKFKECVNAYKGLCNALSSA